MVQLDTKFKMRPCHEIDDARLEAIRPEIARRVALEDDPREVAKRARVPLGSVIVIDALPLKASTADLFVKVALAVGIDIEDFSTVRMIRV